MTKLPTNTARRRQSSNTALSKPFWRSHSLDSMTNGVWLVYRRYRLRSDHVGNMSMPLAPIGWIQGPLQGAIFCPVVISRFGVSVCMAIGC